MSVVPKGNMLLIMEGGSGFSRRAIKDAETEERPPIDGDYGEFMEETERGREQHFSHRSLPHRHDAQHCTDTISAIEEDKVRGGREREKRPRPRAIRASRFVERFFPPR